MTAQGSDRVERVEEGADAPAKLIVLTGRNKGNSYIVPARGRLTIGRADANDVVVEDTEVSRQHCSIIADGGAYQFRDGGSTNGSFVGGERVTEARLEAGAKISIGRTTFVFVLTDEAEPPVAAVAAEKAGEPVAPRPRSRRRLVFALAAAGVAAAAVVLAFLASRSGLSLVGGERSVAVATTPPGAEVFVDNEFVGLTPIEVRLAASDPHALRLARCGYVTWRVAVDSDTPRNLTVTLEPEPVATLIVRASKPETEVYLDGRLVGQAGPEQPLALTGVRLGEHELRLQRPNYLAWYQRIDVTRAVEVPVYAKLESREESSLLGLIAKEPNSALLYTELGHLRMVSKRLDKAMEAYQKALELVYGGNDTSNYSSRLRAEIQKVVAGGEGLFKYGTKEETRAACERLEDVFVSLAAKYPAAKANLHWLLEYYASRNQQEDTGRLYKKMLAMEPDNVELYYEVAAQCLARNDYEAAIGVLQQAAKKFPDTWAVHYRLGLAYSRKAASDFSEADKQLAITHLEKARELCDSPAYKRNIEYYITKAREVKVH